MGPAGPGMGPVGPGGGPGMGLVAIGAVGPGEGAVDPLGTGEEVFERSRRGLRLKEVLMNLMLKYIYDIILPFYIVSLFSSGVTNFHTTFVKSCNTLC